MAIETVGFVGLGLIGGSLAKVIRRVHPEMKLIATNRSKSSLVSALEDGTLNQAQDTIDESFGACDIIFLCAPVEVNIACMKTLSALIKPDCILSDVGSVKTPIHEAVEKIGLSGQFIGGHPMAGSERTGYANASDRLLENAYYILTPTKETPEWMLAEYRALVASIDSLPVVLDCREHDRITAAISHLPHVIAYTLVNLVKRSDNEEGLMRMLAAGGFKDITRIASSSSEMWEQICEENREPLIRILDEYRESLGRMEQAIRVGDGEFLRKEFDTARIYRDRMPQNLRGSLPRQYEISVDINDEPGAIAMITAILSANHISIRNIRIMNNRESQDGVLKILFHDEASRSFAVAAIRRRNFTVYV